MPAGAVEGDGEVQGSGYERGVLSSGVFSLASIATGRRFSAGGRGQVAKSV
jgi:hypothetical protein